MDVLGWPLAQVWGGDCLYVRLLGAAVSPEASPQGQLLALSAGLGSRALCSTGGRHRAAQGAPSATGTDAQLEAEVQGAEVHR